MHVHLGLAIDEVLFNAVESPGYAGPAILRCYQFSPPSMVLGCHQDISEVDVSYIASKPLQLGRRITGGGAIIMGVPDADSQLGVSIIVRHGPGFPVKPGARYALLASPVVEALRLLGLDVVYEMNSDITLGGRKIAGQAAVLAGDVTFLHSSITIEYDLATMLRVARVEPDAIAMERHGKKFTTLKDHLPGISVQAVKAALAQAIASTLGGPVEPVSLSPLELDRARALVASKHGDPRYLFSDGGNMGSCFL